jgi:cytochrome c553
VDEVAVSVFLGRQLWRRRTWLMVLAVLASIGNRSNAQNVDFTRDIEPIFHERCYLCHGPAQAMNGLRLDHKDKALEGGYSGALILPGDSAASKLIARVTSSKEGHRMPPVGEALSAQQIAVLKAWIDGGAVWPERAPAPELSEKEKTIAAGAAEAAFATRRRG